MSPGYVYYYSPLAAENPFRIYSYYRCDKNTAEVLWRLSNDDALLLKLQAQQYLLLSPFVFERNEMGLSPYFTRVLRYFLNTAVQADDREYECGDELSLDRPRYNVRSPGAQLYQVQEPFYDTYTAGFYILESEGLRKGVAVNIPTAETMQKQISQAACSATWLEEQDYAVLRDSIRGREANTLFFVLAALFLVFEMLLSEKGEKSASWKR